MTKKPNEMNNPERPKHHNSKEIRDDFFEIANPQEFKRQNSTLDNKTELDINSGLVKIASIIGQNSAVAVKHGYQHAPDEIKANILSTISITIAAQEVAKNLNIELDECINLTQGSFITKENIECCSTNSYPSINEEILGRLGYAPVEIIALGLLQLANIRIMNEIYQQTSTSK